MAKGKEELESWLKTQHSKKLISWHPGSSLHGKQMGKQWKQWQTLFSWAPGSLWTLTIAIKLKDVCPLKKSFLTNLDSVLKSRDIALLTKVPLVKAMAFPVVTYRCESWIYRRLSAEELMLSNCGVGEDSEEPLNCKQVKPVNPKGNQSWIFIGRTRCWSWSSNTLATCWEEPSHWKRPWCWKDWRQEKGRVEDEIVRWHHWLNRHEFEKDLGDSKEQGSLACCSPWGCKELDTTDWAELNWTRIIIHSIMESKLRHWLSMNNVYRKCVISCVYIIKPVLI